MTLEDWTTEQTNRIYTTEDLPAFNEITGCIKGGFLRSSYIVAWVAIVENLKSKILQSSNLGDKQAEDSYKLIEDAEAKKLSVDKIILEEVVKLNLIDSTELVTLNYLWQQRCLFAHPYNLAPNLDECKFIIINLVAICLSKPLLYKKNFLEELILNITTKPHFISGDTVKLKEYYEKILIRVTDDLHPFLFKTLLFELGKVIEDDTKSDIKNKLRLFIMILLNITTKPLDEMSWSLENRVVNYTYNCFCSIVTPNIWKKLPLRIKEILVDYGINETNEIKLRYIKSGFSVLIKENVLEQNFQDKYIKKLDSISFEFAKNFYGHKSKLCLRIMNEFDSGQFSQQNTIIEYLKNDDGDKFLQDLENADQIEVGKRITYCVRNGCYIGNDYFNKLATNGKTPKFVAFGMLLGSIINRSGDFSNNLRNFVTAVKIINHFESVDNTEIFELLNVEIDKMGDKRHHNTEEEIEYIKTEILSLGLKNSIAASDALEKLKPFKYEHKELIL